MPNFLSVPEYYTTSGVYVSDQFDVLATGETEVALGKDADAKTNHSVAIGADASVASDSGTSIGCKSGVFSDHGVAIGAEAIAMPVFLGGATIQIGSNKVKYSSINFGNKSFIDLVYPVGSIYMSANDTNPASLFGGTWVAWGSGRVPVGVNASDSDFNTAEKTGGTKSVTFTPSISTTTTEGGTDGFPAVSSVSANQSTVSVLQPYITCYMWKRTE